MIIYDRPHSSPVLDELGARSKSAMQAYRDALAEFRREHWQSRGYSRADDEQFSRDAFERTQNGAKLAKAALAAQRAHENAYMIGASLNFAGHVIHMRDLAPVARDAAYRAAAEHGRIDDWPAEVREEVWRICRENPRPETYAEAADRRRRELSDSSSAIDAMLDRYGLNPLAWPEDEIDRIARTEIRLAVFDRLVARARGLHTEWATLSVEEHPLPRRVDERQEQEARARRERRVSLENHIQGVATLLAGARGKREVIVAHSAAMGQTVDTAEMDREIAQYEAQLERLKAELAALDAPAVDAAAPPPAPTPEPKARRTAKAATP